MRRFFVLAIGVALAVSLTACGGGDGDANNGGGDNNGIEPVEIGELDDRSFKRMRAEAYARARCETAFNDCPNSARFLGATERTTDVQGCVDGRMAFYDGLPHSTAAGVSFDEEAARECLVDVITAQRKDVCYYPDRAQSEACDQALRPTLDDGEQCTSFEECKSGECVRSATGGGGVGGGGGGVSCTGTCGITPDIAEAGEACGFDTADCDETQNLLCNYGAQGPTGECVESGTLAQGDTCSNSFLCEDGLVCRDDICTTLTPSQEGEACEKSPSNTTAPDPQPCAPGLVCAGLDANNLGTCAALAAEGEDCAESSDCVWNAYCDGSNCQLKKGEGEACSDSDECRFPYSCALETCEESPVDNQCVQGG
jgi:hypothetical protein